MKKLRYIINNIWFLLKPALRYGKSYLFLLLVMQSLPRLVNSLVSVATPKVAIDGLMSGTPVNRIILNVGMLVLLQLMVGMITSVLNFGYQVKQNEFSLLFTKLILKQAIKTDYRFLDRPEYYAKYQLTYQQFSLGSQNVFNNFASLLSSLLTCAAMFTVIALLGPWVVLIVVVGSIAQVIINLKDVKFSMNLSASYLLSTFIETEKRVKYNCCRLFTDNPPE